jgi:hypothetical protein
MKKFTSGMRVGKMDIEFDVGKVIATRDKSVGVMRGRRKIFIPRNWLPDPSAKMGDIIGKIMVPFYLARKFGLLAAK